MLPSQVFSVPLLSNKEAEEALFLSIAQKYNLSEEEVYYIWMNQWKSLNKYVSNNPDKCHSIEITDLIKMKCTVRNLRAKVYSMMKICNRYLADDRTLEQKLYFIGRIEKTVIFIKKSFELKIEDRERREANCLKKNFVTDKHQKAINEYKAHIGRLEKLIDSFQRFKDQDQGNSTETEGDM